MASAQQGPVLLYAASPQRVSSFLRGLLELAPASFPSIACEHYVFQPGASSSAAIVVVDAAYKAEMQHSGTRELVFMVPSLAPAIQRALRNGGEVIQQAEHNPQPMAVVKGPEHLKFVLVEQPPASPHCASETLLHSIMGAQTIDEGLQVPAVVPKDFQTYLHTHGNDHLIYPNSSRPIPFTNELFVGQCVWLVRTDPLSEEYKHKFEGTQIMFEVQVQGKFTRKPTGKLYLGAETTKKMQLGMITRGLAGAVLQFARTINPLMHHGFGDDNDQELPHLVSPIWSTVDKLVVTPPGETPPELGGVLPETPASRANRKSSPGMELEINLDSVYSFSVNSDFIDLNVWTLMNLPLIRPVDLHTFWGQGDLQLIAYELQDEPGNGKSKNATKHTRDRIEYFFKMRLAHRSNHAKFDARRASRTLFPEFPQKHTRGVSEYVDEDGFFDTVDRESEWEFSATDHFNEVRESTERKSGTISEQGSADISKGSPKRSMLGWLSKGMHDNSFSLSSRSIQGDQSGKGDVLMSSGADSDDDDRSSILPSGPKLAQTFSESGFLRTEEDPELQNFTFDDDLQYVPAVFEVEDSRKEGRRRALFAFKVPNSAEGLCVLRSYSEFGYIFPVLPASRLLNYQRLTINERKRQQLTSSFKRATEMAATDATIEAAITDFSSQNPHRASFLAPLARVSRRRKDVALVKHEGHVAMALGRRHWSEECLQLTWNELLILRPAEKYKPRHRIAITSIIRVQPMEATQAPPLEGFSFFTVETFAKIYYFMVQDDADRARWLTAFEEVLLLQRMEHPETRHLADAEDSVDQFLAKPGEWDLQQRRVLNLRKILFSTADCENELSKTQNQIVEELLDLGLTLAKKATQADKMESGMQTSSATDRTSAHRRNGDHRDTTALWIEFMDALSVLQVLPVHTLNHRERVALFINVYHCMILHSYMLLGAPSSITKWPSFFNTVSYEAFGDVFSISELEHCIIRPAMAKPSNFLSKFLIPSSSRYPFALSSGDFRIHFAMNSGALHLPSEIIIYTPQNLDEELDQAASMALRGTVQISVEKRQVILPKVCEWFFDDFVQSTAWRITSAQTVILRRDSSSADMLVPKLRGQSSDVVKAVLPYLDSTIQQQLRQMLSDGGALHVRYKSFEFECRLLQKAPTASQSNHSAEAT